MSAAASRAVLRHSRFAVRRAGIRNASSTTEAAKEKAAEASSKASEGLSKVTSSAGAALNKVGSAAGDAVNNVGGRTGGLIGRVTGLVPQVTYYSRVGLELGKLVVQQRAMAPPSTATIQTYFQPLVNALRHPMTLFARTAESSAVQPTNILSQVRNMSNAQWISVGVITAEVIGFFSIGEIVGRFKLVGYRSSAAEHH